MRLRMITMASVAIACAQELKFEVASVKLSPVQRVETGAVTRSGNRNSMHGAQVYSAIVYAYHVRGASEIEGWDRGPVSSDVYDFDAEAPESATFDQIRQMFQALLADRFHMKWHRESKPAEFYQLSLGKGAPKLTESVSEEPMKVTIEGRTLTTNAGSCFGTGWNDGTHLLCHGVTMDQIARGLASALGGRLTDATGLKGKYDLHLIYWPD